MSLYDDILAISPLRLTRDEVVEYYQKQYPGSRTDKRGKTTYQWQSRLADDLAPIADVKRESIMRRFQKGRKGKAEEELSAKHQAEYAALGATLPPAPPGNGYHIWGTVWVQYDDQPCEEREVDEEITGDEAEQLLQMSDRDMADAVVAHYFEQDFGTETPVTIGSCQEPDLHVEAL